MADPVKLASKVLSMADLIDYQEGAVVSRTLIDKTAGSVTLFSFAGGQGLSEHTAPFDALVYILDGQVDITISGNTLRLKAGDMTIMPANEPHGLKAVTNFKMALTMIKA